MQSIWWAVNGHITWSFITYKRVTKSRRMRWAGHVARMGEIRNAYKMLVGKPEGKRPFGGPKCRWEDNIRLYLRELGWEGVGWIHLAQDTDQWWTLVNLGCIKGGEFVD
jgi:hypothetical protein